MQLNPSDNKSITGSELALLAS
uniref:Uncharacterized protein n=1 Tax=Arundo donax TaxID=35708 RepID=A0A0A9EIT5_ARUDO